MVDLVMKSIGLRFASVGLIAVVCCEMTLAESRLPREAVVCGPNALVLFLGIQGVFPSASHFEHIDCGSRGASMLDLCNAAKAVGIDAEVRQVRSPSELRFPAILQTRGGGDRKHYMVGYSRGSKSVCVFDATTGKKVVVRDERFPSYFTGYVIVAKPSMLNRAIGILYWISIGLFVYQLLRLIHELIHKYWSLPWGHMSSC